MWTSCPSENLPGSVSPSPWRLITSLIFINSWGFFIPLRLEIEMDEVREGAGGMDGGDATPFNNNNNGIRRKQSSWSSVRKTAAWWPGRPWRLPFKTISTGLQGQFGQSWPPQPTRHYKRKSPQYGRKTPQRPNNKQVLLIWASPGHSLEKVTIMTLEIRCSDDAHRRLGLGQRVINTHLMNRGSSLALTRCS